MHARLGWLATVLSVLILIGCGGSPGSRSIGSSSRLAGLSGRELLLHSSFQAGVSHVSGRYGFTHDNFLLEGAQRIRDLGTQSIFVYMTPSFRRDYPDRGVPGWPASDPHSLTELAQTMPFRTLFQMPFRTYVITIFTFANYDNIAAFATDTNAAAAEEKETYDLARHLLKTYADSGKIFILKNWEGDYAALQCFDTSGDISPAMVTAMTRWMSVRQRGVERARADTGDRLGVGVFYAVEVNRIMDYSRLGRTRLVNAVLPNVNADLVSYSSYDSSLAGGDAVATATAMQEAFDVIYRFAPDPLGLGNRRLFISEYGLFENERPDEIAWRASTVLKTTQSTGALGAFHWGIYDNECKDANGNYFPAGSADGLRPLNSQCRGLWLVRPDGSESTAVNVLRGYWNE